MSISRTADMDDPRVTTQVDPPLPGTMGIIKAVSDFCLAAMVIPTVAFITGLAFIHWPNRVVAVMTAVSFVVWAATVRCLISPRLLIGATRLLGYSTEVLAVLLAFGGGVIAGGVGDVDLYILALSAGCGLIAALLFRQARSLPRER